MKTTLRKILCVATLVPLGFVAVNTAFAQAADNERAAVLAIVEEALARISDEDMVGFTDLMMEGAVIGAAGQRPGEENLFARLRSRAVERESEVDVDIVERGFDARIMISGPVAMAWVPYDLYRDGEWSHCGVDVFSFLRDESGWRIAAVAYSVEQPPACEPHPDGAP